ncbi:MAG: hypothetical protein JXR94_21970 [Candidatus Hydrogenedentes bacterium]|nr:hypothetical protein [Candidatus Hydrogenedentota bacterium]
MNRFALYAVAAAFAYAPASTVGADTPAAVALEVGSERQLFIDGLFFEDAQGIELRLHPALKTGEKNLTPDRPWESATLNWLTVMEDPEGAVGDGMRYRMWYECYDVEGWPTNDDTSFCYAESADGVHWLKPPLGLFEYKGAKDTNILFRMIGPEGARSRVHGTGVFMDPTAPPDARYKAVSQGTFTAEPSHAIGWGSGESHLSVAGMYSADGLHWTRYGKSICHVMADSQYSAFWDAAAGQYILYGRVGGRGRSIGRTAGEDFTTLEPPARVLEVDDNDPPDSDLYNPAAMKYPYAANVYLMFPSLYQHGPDTLDIRFAVSRDGVHWTRPGQTAAFIPLGEAGDFDSGSLYMGQGMLRVGDELWQYYSGSPLKHNEATLERLIEPQNARAYTRVVTRLDGYVSADAGAAGGSFTTPPLLFDGSVLKLNVAVRKGGSLRVGLLAADGSPVPGRSVEDCAPITADAIDYPVRWKDGADVSARAGIATKLRFELADTSLYAFGFAAAPDVAATPALAAGPRFIKVVRVDAAPVVDGALDDGCWKQAEAQEGFYQHKTTEPAPRGTTLWMCYDDEALYVAADCRDEAPQQLKIERTQRDDPGMWRDSTIELFLKPDELWPQLLMVPPEEQHVHLILTALGTQYDQLGTQASAAWSGNWTSATARTDTGWTAELAIPFKMFELAAPERVSLWHAQIARNAQGPREGATWTPTGAIYREHTAFGALVFVPDPAFQGNLERQVVMQLRIRPAMAPIEAMLARLAAPEAELGPDAPAAQALARLEERWAAFCAQLAPLDDTVFLQEWKVRLARIEEFGSEAQTVARDATDAILAQRHIDLAVYPWPAITDDWITPSSFPDPAALSQPVTMRVCPDEFEPASCVLYAPSPLSDVAISVDAPACGTNRLPDDAVDVRVVKCWYQRRPTSIQGAEATLLPELLVNDPARFEVNHETERNDVPGYAVWAHPGDADTLQPFSLPAHFAQQIWLTVHPPADAAPGVYTSAVHVTSAEGVSASIPLRIEVLDFPLEPSPLDHGLYNMNNRWGTQDEAYVLGEMRNLNDHGITHMMVRDSYEHLGRILPLMRQAGLRTDRLFSFGCRLRRDKDADDIEPLDEFKEKARRYIDAAKQAGAGDVYIYLIDEATGETLAKERPYAEAVRALGGKTAVACNSAFFEIAGDFIDAPIVASVPMAREQVDAIHAKGARLYCYANPQCGLELPETYRRNFGLLLWQAGYDGSMDFAFYWPFGSIWDDFDHPSYKDHNMAYPTKKGLIDTIQWEGWREGADDCRYVATLMKAIDEASDSEAARRARQWLDGLRNGGAAALADLDGVRTALIEHIRACRAGRGAKHTAATQ